MSHEAEVPAGEFKAKCLKLMDEVARTRVGVTITKRGRPVARLVPIEGPEHAHTLFGYMAGTITFAGDVVQSRGERWAAESGEEDELYARHSAATHSEARHRSVGSRAKRK